VKFDKGDYVLVAVAEPQNLSKLQPDWMVLIKSLRLPQIGCFSSNIWTARLKTVHASEGRTNFKQSLHYLFSSFYSHQSYGRDEADAQGRCLIGDKELFLVFWTLSSFVATLSGAIGHVGAQVSFRTTSWSGQNQKLKICESYTLGSCRMPRKSNVLLPESLDQNQIARLVSWIYGRPLMKPFHHEGHRSLLKLCRDLCLTQGTRSVFPVLE
jgi:hypothetical protein